MEASEEGEDEGEGRGGEEAVRNEHCGNLCVCRLADLEG